MLNIYFFMTGKYALLCVISHVETERMVVGYCRECGRQDLPEKFEQDETDLLCCSKVNTQLDTVGLRLFLSRMENESAQSSSSALIFMSMISR